MSLQHEIEIRVRYSETDGQGRVHHAQYLNYFERGRVELLRAQGFSYRDFERSGLMLVVTEMNVRYLDAAEFDDLLVLTTEVTKTKRVRIGHRYRLTRPAGHNDDVDQDQNDDRQKEALIVEAVSTIACIDRNGKLTKLPDYLRF